MAAAAPPHGRRSVLASTAMIKQITSKEDDRHLAPSFVGQRPESAVERASQGEGGGGGREEKPDNGALTNPSTYYNPTSSRKHEPNTI
jgi:hypothetical protein